jgi:NADH dehydrogenase
MSWSKASRIGAAGAGVAAGVLARRLWKRAAIRRKNRAINRRNRIVVLGAGFAGMHVAQELAKLLPAGEHGDITLIDQNNYLLFTPMLTEVAGGELDPQHIVASPRRLSPRINFEQARVEDINLAEKAITVSGPNDENSQRVIRADRLVIAVGSVPNYHKIPGLREHSLAMKNLADAAATRNRVLACLERANREEDDDAKRALLSFVVGGGGYTGVETMAAINDLARSVSKQYPRVRADEITTLIVEPGERLLPELSPDLAAFAQKKLEARGVRVLLRTKVTSAAEAHVELEGGRKIQTRTLIWAGGITPNPLVGKLNCKRGRHGGIVVDKTCAIAEHRDVWALGDCAEIPKIDSKGTRAPTAQNATREGELVARNIVAAMRGEAPQPFTFTPIGELALVGRHSGVAKLYGYHFSGFLAWAMWRAIYLSKMPGMAQRSRIAIDWLLDFIYGRNVAEFPVDASVIGPRPTEPVHHPG